ncbi:DUF397 domain-containing protein [Actinomadura luteofluorescens]|uniref:DUF397 domain-containing protein n=1 Tax=Actinomadura luteofluorescens TaxID=46163 RepID=UPI0015C7D292|nr:MULTISPECIES: DUF397 domain-containing protein [Actinomadura]
MELSRLDWRRASKSHEDGDQCVEIASGSDEVSLRDSKDPDGPKLVVSRSDFRYFVSVLKAT